MQAHFLRPAAPGAHPGQASFGFKEDCRGLSQRHHLASLFPSLHSEILRKNAFGNISKSGFCKAVASDAATFSIKAQNHGELSGQLDWRLCLGHAIKLDCDSRMCCQMAGVTALLTAASMPSQIGIGSALASSPRYQQKLTKAPHSFLLTMCLANAL